MKSVLAGLSLISVVFAAQAAESVEIDKEAQTITFAQSSTNLPGKVYAVVSRKILDCRFGTLSHIAVGGAVSMIDVLGANSENRAATARKICTDKGLTPGF